MKKGWKGKRKGRKQREYKGWNEGEKENKEYETKGSRTTLRGREEQ